MRRTRGGSESSRSASHAASTARNPPVGTATAGRLRISSATQRLSARRKDDAAPGAARSKFLRCAHKIEQSARRGGRLKHHRQIKRNASASLGAAGRRPRTQCAGEPKKRGREAPCVTKGRAPQRTTCFRRPRRCDRPPAHPSGPARSSGLGSAIRPHATVRSNRSDDCGSG